MVEVALAQVEARCARGGDSRLHIAGFYHANRSMKDSTQVRWSDLCKLIFRYKLYTQFTSCFS